MNQHPRDLLYLLLAIKEARRAWLNALQEKTRELIYDRPNANPFTARQRALVCKEVQAEYEKLLNLYSVLGDGLPEYIPYVDSLELGAVRKSS